VDERSEIHQCFWWTTLRLSTLHPLRFSYFCIVPCQVRKDRTTFGDEGDDVDVDRDADPDVDPDVDPDPEPDFDTDTDLDTKFEAGSG
jgi:hypothetical protein